MKSRYQKRMEAADRLEREPRAEDIGRPKFTGVRPAPGKIEVIVETSEQIVERRRAEAARLRKLPPC